ncbi:MAG: hypothetical protein JWM11_7369 [Planctomycetaceae bacterium]|nr:hypothetical protein [Planctomycetaceae bacterium]
MGRRTKKTTVYTGIFGEKHIVTRWGSEPGWGGTLVAVFIIFMLLRGCS